MPLVQRLCDNPVQQNAKLLNFLKECLGSVNIFEKICQSLIKQARRYYTLKKMKFIENQ